MKFSHALARERMDEGISSLSTIIDSDQLGWSRVALTEFDVAGRNWALKQMRELGLNPYIDSAGNVLGILPGRIGGRSLMIGSHTDTVPGGGRFDGNVGVLGSFEVVRQLREAEITLDHDLIVAVFFSEEPNSYGISCIGSRALTGTLTVEHLKAQDEAGGRFGNALQFAGIDATQIFDARLDWSTIDAFLELHIEQGPVLEELGSQVGLVQNITGISRFRALSSAP